jgi:zinc transporter ZupT
MSDGDGGFLVQLGINVHDMIAGFAGGTVNALVLKQSDPWSIIASMVAGALTANYMTDPVSRYLGTSAGTSGFIVGVTSMALVQGLIAAARSWKPVGPGGGGSGGGGDARSGS